MNRRQAANVEQWAAQDAAGNPECLLCGARTPVFADPYDAEALAAFDLCGRCNGGFSELAQALADAEEARARRAEVTAQVDQVVGQLELGDAELAAHSPALTGGQWDQVFQGLASDDWAGVDTMTVAEAVREGTWTQGLTHAELQKLRRVLARRS